jgi:hypothetical protein
VCLAVAPHAPTEQHHTHLQVAHEANANLEKQLWAANTKTDMKSAEIQNTIEAKDKELETFKTKIGHAMQELTNGQ